mmetsp:Transcript_71305/g.133374  ORF Transcript_71305/g.133374 Transcript_71305/m.133374 type:complete len:243 (-) Transcript_71305:64-792(-)
MQSTKAILNEIQGQKLPRTSSNACAMPTDYAFAELAVGEKQQLLPKVVDTSYGVWRSILDNTQDWRWVFGAWTVEVVWMLFVAMLAAVELWSHCPFEFGALACTHCFSGDFLTWQAVVLVLWVLNLYTFILLVSRGFHMSLKRIGSVLQDNKGVPAVAILLLLTLTGLLFLTFLIGLGMVYHSRLCEFGDALYEHPQRSPLMFWSTLLTTFVAPLLILTGRCTDLGRKVWGCCERSPEYSSL